MWRFSPRRFVLGAVSAATIGSASVGEAPLRCPTDSDQWPNLLAQVRRGLALLLEAGDGRGARELLAGAVDSATADLDAAFACPVGVAAAFRALALAHGTDPAVLSGASRGLALQVALRLQQLAAGWLIYAYNVHAHHDAAFIDDSAWPIKSMEFDYEHLFIARVLAEEGGAASWALSDVPRTYRLQNQSLGIVTLCDYPPEKALPRFAASAHSIYAARHGYGYRVHRDPSHAEGRPPAWGKLRVVQAALEEGIWDWVLWIDCDLYFMDLDTTIDSLLLRYGSDGNESALAIDPSVHLLLTEDSQMLNTAIFLMRRSAWSLDLLRKVWGPDESPFINHTWWEQAAFAQELLGSNHRRFATIDYDMPASDQLSVYPTEVRVIPQFEMNSYHAISARQDSERWTPGKFVVSFNGAQSLSGPTVASILHANYYELFCRLNGVEHLCEGVDEALFAPWLAAIADAPLMNKI